MDINFQALLYEAQKRKDLIKQIQKNNSQANTLGFRPVQTPEMQGLWGALQGEKNSLQSAINGL